MLNQMKKTMRTLRLWVVLAMLLGTVGSWASVYTWSQHDLTFETPDDGVVTFSTPTYFEIRWDEMVLTIQLYKREHKDEKRIMRENLQRKAMSYNMYDTSDGRIKVKGFDVYSIDGTMPDGSRAIIADLVSKKKDIVAEVTINYLYGNREVVEDIIKSFTTVKQKPNKEQKRQRIQSKEDADKQDKQLEEERRRQQRTQGKLYDA